jgi:hypothetical protein
MGYRGERLTVAALPEKFPEPFCSCLPDKDGLMPLYRTKHGLAD